MPLTYSIATGIGLSFITYALAKIVAGTVSERCCSRSSWRSRADRGGRVELGGGSRQRCLDRQEVAPGEPLADRIAQQKSRMKRRHGANLTRTGLIAEPAASCPGDAFVGCEQRLRRRIAETNQHFGIDQLDLTLREREADRGLLRRRRAVTGRPPWHDICDVDTFAIEPDRRQHTVKELPGATNKRQALDVLVAAGGLAHEHQSCVRIAVREDELRCGCPQRTALEMVENVTQFVQAYRSARSFACRHHGGIRRGGCLRRLHTRAAGARGAVSGGGMLTCWDSRGWGQWTVVRLFERRRSILGQPIDRILADHHIHARLVVEGNELAGDL